jgi:glycosyltransferase involved in cell wall biosynthesis
MKVAVSIVGKRTEHWEGLFAALARLPDLEVRVQAADITPLTRARFERLSRKHAAFHFHVAPHFLGEEQTGHMASIALRRGSWAPLRTFAPDILHVIGEPAYLSTLQAIRFRNRHWPRVPITHYAAQNVVTRFPPPFPSLEHYAYGQIARAFPITPAALGVLRRKGYGGDAQVVPLGVDHGRFRPRSLPPPTPFTVGFVGRLEPHKGIADLVRATEMIDSQLLLVGDGSLTPWLEEQAAERRGAIHLRRWVDHDELPAWLARMHVLALPAVEVMQRNLLPWIGVPLREQFGRVLIEAMATGLPVVATDVGEIPHVVGGAGLVVRARDVDALAGALARLRDEPALAARLGAAGIARARRFRWDSIAQALQEAWLSVAESRWDPR